MSLTSVDHLLSVKAVLTPEQFKTFVNMNSATTGSRRVVGGVRRGDGEGIGGGE